MGKTKNEMIDEYYKSRNQDAARKAYDAISERLLSGEYEYVGGGGMRRKARKTTTEDRA